MPTTRICQISDEMFGGFQITIDIDYYYDNNEIVDYVKKMLINTLNRHHLGQLSVTAKNKNFHIHDKDIYDLRRSLPGEIIYVCGHC